MEKMMQTIKLNNAVKNDEWTNREELPDPETLPTLHLFPSQFQK